MDVLPGWTVREVKSSECIERKDGSESQSERKQVNRNTGPQTQHTVQDDLNAPHTFSHSDFSNQGFGGMNQPNGDADQTKYYQSH